MEIAKAASVPPDHGLQSLLTMSGEVRNMVYGLIFKREGSVLIHNIHNVRAYRAPNPTLPEDNSGNTNIDRATRNHIAQLEPRSNSNATEEEQLKAFDHRLDEGFGLLKSCRQVYHEASSVLYGHNSFLITRVLSRHDCIDDDFSYYQLHYAPIWVRALGTQSSLLRKVKIDLSSICDHDCNHVDDDFDMFPLLRLLWKALHAQCDITFASTARYLESEIHNNRDAEANQRFALAQVASLNNALLSLARHDDLDLKAHVVSGNYVDSVSLVYEGNELEGQVSYFDDTPYYVNRRFEAVADDLIIWKPRPRVESWFSLPFTVRDQIIDYATSSTAGLVVDLEKQATRGLDFAIFEVLSKDSSFVIFYDAVNAISRRVPVTLEMTSMAPITDFDNFGLLKDVWTVPYPDDADVEEVVTNIIMPQSATHGKCSILLRLVFENHAVNPRIKLNDLIYITCNHKHKIRDGTDLITALFTRKGDKPNLVTTITLGKLRKPLFLILTDLLIQMQADRWQCLPDIWMDETGNIVSSSFGHPSAMVDSWDTVVNGEEFIHMAKRIDYRYEALQATCMLISQLGRLHVLRMGGFE